MSRPHFPQWNYGYTLGPPSMAHRGDYSMFYRGPMGGGPGPMGGGPGPMGGPGPYYGPPRFSPGGRPPYRGPRPDARSRPSVPAAASPAPPEPTVAKADPAASAEGASSSEAAPSDPPAVAAEPAELTPERPLSDILKGRNPIMFCNDQSKIRKLHMDWEQISETGPPHDKTFTWSLKMGDMSTMGVSNSKKSAKNKAAEAMVQQLDRLPKVVKRSYYPTNQFYPPPGFRMPPPWQMNGPGPPMSKRRRQDPAPPGPPGAVPDDSVAPTPAKTQDVIPKVVNASQNNPISKLYEHTKKKKLPEPVFETISENVLEARKTPQGFVLKKTEFTVQCALQGQQFSGTAMTKKQAKHNAAAAAWAEIGAGVGQDSINDLLETQRNITQD